MAITWTLTSNWIPDESKPRGWYHLMAKGNATGDGSGGALSGDLDISSFLTNNDKVWLADASYATEDTNAHMLAIQADQQSWSNLKVPSGVLATLAVLKVSGILLDSTYTTEIYVPNVPFYLGKPLVSSSNTIHFKAGLNTNGKAYRCHARFSVYRVS